MFTGIMTDTSNHCVSILQKFLQPFVELTELVSSQQFHFHFISPIIVTAHFLRDTGRSSMSSPLLFASYQESKSVFSCHPHWQYQLAGLPFCAAGHLCLFQRLIPEADGCLHCSMLHFVNEKGENLTLVQSEQNMEGAILWISRKGRYT